MLVYGDPQLYVRANVTVNGHIRHLVELFGSGGYWQEVPCQGDECPWHLLQRSDGKDSNQLGGN